MALSGSVKTSTYGSMGLQLSWSATQSVANNQSTISWTLKSFGRESNFYYVSGPVTVVINGTTVLSITDRFNLYGNGNWSKSGSLKINHNNDGTKSFSVSISAAIYTYAVNCTGSGTFTLDKIARTPSAPTSCTASAGNGSMVAIGETITVNWSGASGVITGYELQYQFDGGSWSSGTSTTKTSLTDSLKDTRKSGQVLKYRVRAMNGSLASSWKESNALTVSGAMDIKVSNAWKTGTVWIKVNGEWKRAKRVWIKVNGTWKQSK